MFESRGFLPVKEKSNDDRTWSRWTQSAKQCYLRGCKCDGCYYQKFFIQSFGENICEMKKTIFKLTKDSIPKELQRTSEENFLGEKQEWIL